MLLLYPVVLTRHADHVVVSAIPANDEIPQSLDSGGGGEGGGKGGSAIANNDRGGNNMQQSTTI
jgi:hypothetical protein